MDYTNPILYSDYSDRDVIRRGDNFYMIASSFNHTPGIPILKSKNLVDWKIIGHVFESIPFERFKDVHHGDGAWAPSLRYHNGLYYVSIPFQMRGFILPAVQILKKGTGANLGV